ncbi:methyl-accepting chemotaxis protein [Alkalihalobacillus sp. LMS39]|uniref:methyl-accepting chemotaxis protein n=1 Tax=Alkalihalobacillus sp. LMS39 TaxID=2924032 RepID=UPI001FB1F3C7|nr:methyl-accepting chemotaxis protein [Alkalihalobacillus sp. LMS39]UOE92599.1 methyl-accepting chemotaxis protein [Alkalihalobacillus sp. LMS39]
MKLTIKKKLIGFVLIIAFFIFVANAFSYFSITKTNESYSYLVDTVSELHNISTKIEADVHKQASNVSTYVLTTDPRYLESIAETNEEINSLIEKARSMATLEETLGHLSEIEEMNNQYIEAINRNANIVTINPEQAALVVASSILPLGQELTNKTLVFSEFLEGVRTNVQAETTNQADQSLLRISVTGIVSLLVVIGGGILIAFLISTPIQKLTKVAKQIASGDLTVEPIQIKSKDEIYELNESFNEMTDNLRTMISTIMANSSQVAASAEQLNASAIESSKATEQITNSIQSVAVGAEKQVEVTVNATNVTGEISQGIEEIANNIQTVTNHTVETEEKSSHGVSVIEQTMKQMEEINVKTNEITDVVTRLEEKSNEIDKIITMITAVSDQTNLLALNAAIEAARAGEHGKGFAVVAEEIRKLAVQSNESANQISQLIHEIQQDIHTSVTAMDEGNASVNEGLTLADQAGTAFKTISNSINDVLTQVQEVSAAVQQISAGTETMVTSIQEASTIAENAAAYSQNVAASTEEQVATMDEITAASTTLTKLADELQETVQKFKV